MVVASIPAALAWSACRRVAALEREGLVCGVQLCDVRADGAPERAMIGQGVADVAGFVRALVDADYGGDYEVELIGASLWDRPVNDFLADIVRACQGLGLTDQ